MANKKKYQVPGMAKRIEECIKNSGLNCVQIAKILGVERKIIYAYKNGEVSPNATILAGMCKLFNVSADWLIFGEKHG